MNILTKEIKIAITAILAITIIYLGIIFLKGLKMFSDDTQYYVEMNDINGVGISSNVLANGLKIGYVKNITYNPTTQHLVLELSIDKNFTIPQGTTIYVSKEMLGAAKLNLALTNPQNPPLTPGDTIHGNPPTDLMANISNMIPTIQNLLPKIDSILTSINNLTADPALPATLHNLQTTTANLATTTHQLDHILAKDIPTLLDTTNHVMANAQTLTNNLNQIDLQTLTTQTTQTLQNANQITAQLNQSLHSKDNTLGLLLNDNTIALHLDTTIHNATLLLQDLRLHPKRYVHFSLFGKKDK